MDMFSFQKLTKEYLNGAAALCDECVGINLYSSDYLATVIGKPNHYFYLIVTPEQGLAGYIYFYLTDLEAMASLSKLSRECIGGISQKANPVIGNLQSIGVKTAARGLGLSKQLVAFYLEQLRTHAVDTAFGVFWKTGDTVPMKQTLESFDFCHLADAHGVWYDNKELICPLCKGRCKCDAEVYYKPMQKEAAN